MNVLCLQNDGSLVDVHIHLVDYECFMFDMNYDVLCLQNDGSSVDVHIHLVDYECFMFTERWFLSRCTYTPC